MANEHDANEEIRRTNGIPTIESKLQGERLRNIYRWYTTKAITYINSKNNYQADIEYLNLLCDRMQIIILKKKITTSLTRWNNNRRANSPHFIKIEQIQHMTNLIGNIQLPINMYKISYSNFKNIVKLTY